MQLKNKKKKATNFLKKLIKVFKSTNFSFFSAVFLSILSLFLFFLNLLITPSRTPEIYQQTETGNLLTNPGFEQGSVQGISTEQEGEVLGCSYNVEYLCVTSLSGDYGTCYPQGGGGYAKYERLPQTTCCEYSDVLPTFCLKKEFWSQDCGGCSLISDPGLPGSNFSNGSTCAVNQDCASEYCDPNLKKCIPDPSESTPGTGDDPVPPAAPVPANPPSSSGNGDGGDPVPPAAPAPAGSSSSNGTESGENPPPADPNTGVCNIPGWSFYGGANNKGNSCNSATVVYHSGTKGLRLVVVEQTTGITPYVVMSQDVSDHAGKTLWLAGWMKSDGQSKGHIGYKDNTDNKVEIINQSPITSTEWTYVEKQITLPANKKISVRLQASDPGKVWFDDIYLGVNKPKTSPNPSTAEGNLLIKFDAVPANNNEINLPEANRQKQIEITFELIKSVDQIEEITIPVSLGYNSSDMIFKGWAGKGNNNITGKMNVLVKGASHRRIRFCQDSGQGPDDICQTHQYFTLSGDPGNHTFDFSSRPLDFGDVDQDGSVGVKDYSAVRGCRDRNAQISDSDWESSNCSYCDANFDGVVDSTDIDLLYKTLSTKPDDE